MRVNAPEVIPGLAPDCQSQSVNSGLVDPRQERMEPGFEPTFRSRQGGWRLRVLLKPSASVQGFALHASHDPLTLSCWQGASSTVHHSAFNGAPVGKIPSARKE